jgi:nicotinate-nucleotide pyrophosphorylase
MIKKLEDIQKACQYGAVIVINNHIAVLDTAADTLEELRKSQPFCTIIHLNEDVQKEIIRTNELVTIKLFIDSMIANFIVCHYSLTQAIDRAWDLLKEKRIID